MLWPLWVILTRANLDVWITCKHSRFLIEPISFTHEPIEQPPLALALSGSLFLALGVSSRPWVLIEVFFELQLCVKTPLLSAELLLFVRFGTTCKRGERGVGGEARGAVNRSIGFILRFALFEKTGCGRTGGERLLFVDEDSLRLSRD